jgi:hypothetical protein
MDLFDEPGHSRPVDIELIGRNPIALVAYKLVDPTLMYIHMDSLQWEYQEETLSDGTPCHTNMMSSDYAKYTQEEIREHDAAGYLIPLQVYADGVSLGARNKVSHVTCMHTLSYMYLRVFISLPTKYVKDPKY